MATYGFATGSNLTDLGRNLVAQETTRNALQAALAAAAAQQGVARTQAGASRYSTDAQREGNQLMAMLRGLEQDRLRQATDTEAGLKRRDLELRDAISKLQYAPNMPEAMKATQAQAHEIALANIAALRQATDTEAGLKRRDLELRDAISKLQYAPNMPEAMKATQAHEIALANIAAAAQRDTNSRVPPQVRREELGLIADADEFNSRIDGAIARANTESDILYDTIIGGRKNYFGLGTSEDEAKRQYVAKAITEVPLKLGEFAPYLIPHEVGGRIRFSAKRRSVPGLSIGGNGLTQTQPLPLPPGVLYEVESALGGSTVPAVPLMRAPTVPRGTNNVPTLPMLPPLPVAPDTEPGFFSRLGQALTGPDSLPIPTTDPGFLTTRIAGGPPTPFEIVIEGSPFRNYWGPPSKYQQDKQVSSKNAQRRIGSYIEFLLDETKGKDATRSAVAVRELARVRRVLGQ